MDRSYVFEFLGRYLAVNRKVFCAPGRNETYRNTLRGLLPTEVTDISAVDFTPEFARLAFTQQMELFKRIIRQEYWSRDTLLLGRSFGAWILLNTLMRLDMNFPGTVILISSVLGSGGKGGLHFFAPRNTRFWQEAEARNCPPVQHLALIHAEDDDQCPYALVEKLCQLWNIELVNLETGGHQLGMKKMQAQIRAAIKRIWLHE